MGRSLMQQLKEKGKTFMNTSSKGKNIVEIEPWKFFTEEEFGNAKDL